jgi:hypothetical protein
MQIKISIHSLTLHQSNSINLCPWISYIIPHLHQEQV